MDPITGVISTTDLNCIPLGTDGATRRLGTDLTNDHPISQTFDSTLATNDGELRTPPHSVGSVSVVDVRSSSTKPKLPLMTGGTVQCNTCHDPHFNTGKFLRLPRFQTTAAPGTPNLANDQVCLGCHNKKGWVGSAHATDHAGTHDTYDAGAASARDFPAGTQVWQAACLNCHDTHGRTGTRRLLREGVDGAARPAVEEVCYQCHQDTGALGLNADVLMGGNATTVGSGIPNIKSEFTGVNKIRMPISDADQRGTGEAHEIVNADFLECRKRLGSTTGTDSVGLSSSTTGTWSETVYCNTTVTAGTNDRRHAECTDCHNPHRVLKNRLFDSTLDVTNGAKYRTHFPGVAVGAVSNGSLNNLASGPLAGTWGVEPSYDVAVGWLVRPTTFTVKFGQPTAVTDRASATHLTREYQLCMKCHSNFAYEDNGEYGGGYNLDGGGVTDTKGNASGRPRLGSTVGSAGGTTSGSNNMSAYTNQAAEFSVRANDSNTGTDQGASGANARRSWHPVHFPTGRTEALRGITTSGAFRAPFTNVGTQTMYCSDCHGAENSWTGGTGPDGTKVQGPHGSTNPFLLRAPWRDVTGESNTGDLCFNCHNSTIYAGSTNTRATGYGHDEKDNHHNYHNADKANGINWRCSYCHVAVPHGWKNKAFLVNLADVGPEGGFAVSTSIVNQSSGVANGYNNPPYYMRAKLRVSTWQASSAWTKGSCFGGEGGMANQCGG